MYVQHTTDPLQFFSLERTVVEELLGLIPVMFARLFDILLVNQNRLFYFGDTCDFAELALIYTKIYLILTVIFIFFLVSICLKIYLT